ncbi:MAG: HDIG domain-containing protein [Armatimonadetes bacterium]|nr:HDIG domain-containing protein [Armatimonadota bacterium]
MSVPGGTREIARKMEKLMGAGNNSALGTEARNHATKVHGSQRLRRGALGALTVGVLYLALWARLLPEEAPLVPGQPSPRTIFAPRSAFFNDTVKTEELREQARRSVADKYKVDPSASEVALEVVQDAFAVLRQAQRLETPSTAERVKWVQRRLDIRLPEESLEVLIEAQPGTLSRLQATAVNLVEALMRRQIRDNTDDLATARREAQEQAARLDMSPDYQRAVGLIAAAALRPNLLYDAVATQTAREAAAAAVKPVRGYIRAGEPVVYEGQIVGQHHLDIAQALGLTQPRVDYSQAVALLALLTLLVVGWGVFVMQFAPSYYAQDKYLFVAAALAVVAAVVFRAAHGAAWFEAAALGTATATTIAVCILTVPLVAVGFGGVLSVVVGLMAAGSDARLVVATLLATVATIGAMGRGFQRTTIIARTALVAALADAVFLLLGNQVYGLLTSWPLIGQTAAAGFLGALAGVGVVLVIQRPLGITTDIWLLELGNPNEPILRRLLTEAPGTYQASLMVATLAEAAAEALGANALLARVAATYHDIGKLRRPGFFIENQFRGENPHEKLSPQVSAMILAAHAREGVEMARQLKLPPEVIAIIGQHHGTSVMSYFHERAKAQAKPGEEVPESLFRYPGPKPQTKEAALVLLADAVEAAARTLESYSPEVVREMVERVVQSKIDDGQLSEAPITLAELEKVKDQLAQTLISAFHRRIPYPEQIEREMAERLQQRRAPLEHRGATSSGNNHGRQGRSA